MVRNIDFLIIYLFSHYLLLSYYLKGAGKSTTVKLISGFSRKSSGQIILLGMNLDGIVS
jgi:ABC-type uncharacterized transport system ATPase subunit